MNIRTKIGKLDLKTPLVLASGILGTNALLLNRCLKSGCGAVTLKSIGPVERLGHNNPTVVEFDAGIMNAVGLPTPGYLNMDKEWSEINSLIKEPVIASVYGGTIEEFAKIAEYISKFEPSMIELNVSCPNKQGGMSFGQSAKMVHDLVKAVKAVTKIPVMPKLTPNCTNIADVAKMAERAGADAICAINTVGPGMQIDINTRKPMLHYKRGGVSGAAIKPVAIRCVYDIYEVVKIPIVGTGGVMSGEDAIEMFMAGASAVGVGSAIYYDGFDAFGRINEQINTWMTDNNVKGIKEIIGVAHK